MNLDALRSQLERLFRQRPVQLAYLFGSQATGHTHADSDMDIAVLLDEALTADGRFAERLSLKGRDVWQREGPGLPGRLLGLLWVVSTRQVSSSQLDADA